jgi:hypothetical protein
MKKIIQIDENARIKIIPDNFMLQYKVNTKTGQIAWHTDGFFADLTSLSVEYISNAPYRAIEGTENFERLIEVVIRSTDQISQVLIDNQPNKF